MKRSRTLKARDAIKEMLDDLSEEASEHPFFLEIVSSFRKLADAEGGRDETPPQYPLPSAGASPFPEKAASSEDPATYRIRFVPSADIFSFGTNPVLLLDELRQMGDVTIVADTDNVPELGSGAYSAHSAQLWIADQYHLVRPSDESGHPAQFGSRGKMAGHGLPCGYRFAGS